MTQQRSSNKNNKRRSSGHRNPKNNNRHRSHNNKRRKNYSKNNNKISLDPVFKKFTILFDEMLQARKKYFEQFHRVDERKKQKLESNYNEKIKQFNQYAEKLNEQEKSKLEQMLPNYSLDTTYSLNHGIKQSDFEAPQVEIVDPHLLESQKQASFGHDTEESSGSMEDYKMYKGIN